MGDPVTWAVVGGAVLSAGAATKTALDKPDVKSKKQLESAAANKAEDARLATAASRKKSGTTKFASSGGIGMSNLKKKAGQ